MLKQMVKVAMTSAIIVAMLVMMPAPVSAASSVKISSVKGVVAKMSDGSTGYLVAKKNLSKGSSLTLKKVSATSKIAKTYVYGKSKGWSAKKLAKALKKPKAYKKVKVSGLTFFKAYKGGKLKYVIIKKVSKPAKPSAPAPEPEPAPQPQSEGSVQSQDLTSPSTDASEAVTQTVAEGAELTVKVASSDTKYNSSVYSLNGLKVALVSEDDSYVMMNMHGSVCSASDTKVVPEGTYDIRILVTEQVVTDGAEPYRYPTDESVVVSGDTVKSISLDPVPGEFGITVSDETAAADDLTVKVDNKQVQVPCTMELPAGENHHVQVIVDGETVMSEPVYIKPGWTDITI